MKSPVRSLTLSVASLAFSACAARPSLSWCDRGSDAEKKAAMPRIAMTLALVLASKAALASVPTVVWCNACSDERKLAAAIESNAGALVYVADVVTGSAIAFDVDSTQSTPNNGRIAGAPAHVAPTPAQAEAIRALADFHETVPKGWRKLSTLHYAQTPINAYSVVRAGPEQRLLIDWVARQPDVVPMDLLRRVAQSVQALGIHPRNAVPSVAYRVEFADGSRINVAFAMDGSVPAFAVHSDPGQDSRRNPVLVEANPLPVEFDFDGHGNPNDDTDWHSHMTALGYSIADDRKAGRWVCANPGTGLRCMRPL